MYDINNSPTLIKYRDTLAQCISLYYPTTPLNDIYEAINYSINKRMYNANAILSNSYKRHKEIVKDKNGNPKDQYVDARQQITLQEISDYILSKQPIVTAFGTMFMHHTTVPNPLVSVVQSFLDNRTKHKKQMFQYPKGSEDFEKFNLLQQLDKIDANGIYGTLGMYSSLLYNSNVATSITSQGRAFVSSMTLHFEMFLADNVKFGSLNEVIEFINHICSERWNRKYSISMLDHIPTKEECFAKLILDTGYRWIPNDNELDIIWKVVNNLTQEDITRVYYKNNLYEFVNNSNILNMVISMLKKLEKPFYASSNVPPEISDDVKAFTDIVMEFVYYRYLYIDRIDRCDNMIKAVTMVSDTDSTIISLDAWYRFIVEKVSGMELSIANYTDDPSISDEKTITDQCSTEKVLDYNFETDEIVEVERTNNPDVLTPNDNVRYSIISILGYVLDHTVNDYMIKACENMNSVKEPYHGQKDCRIWAKSEFLFRRLMMTKVKKNYASLIEIQEGNMVPEDSQLDIKGIEALTKSSKPISTRKALQKILMEDILKAPTIDQLKIIKDIAIFEKQIMESVRAGNKEFFKPVTIKSISAYDDPLRIQGIKASMAWNAIKPAGADGIDINERNAVDIAKVNIDRNTIEKIKDTYPEVYANMVNALDDDTFKTFTKDPKTGEKTKLVSNSIDAVAIPMDTSLPGWLEPFIDYNSIINDNISGFPFESVGIQRMNKRTVNYSNIVQL